MLMSIVQLAAAHLAVNYVLQLQSCKYRVWVMLTEYWRPRVTVVLPLLLDSLEGGTLPTYSSLTVANLLTLSKLNLSLLDSYNNLTKCRLHNSRLHATHSAPNKQLVSLFLWICYFIGPAYQFRILTPTTVAGVRRSSVCVCDCACLSVCLSVCLSAQ